MKDNDHDEINEVKTTKIRPSLLQTQHQTPGFVGEEQKSKHENETKKLKSCQANGEKNKTLLDTSAMDDSGVAISNQFQDSSLGNSAKNCSSKRSPPNLIQSSEENRYQSPILIEDADQMAEDAYDVVQVRDAVDHLKDQRTKNSLNFNEAFSERMNEEDQIASEDSVEAQVNSSPLQDPRNPQEIFSSRTAYTLKCDDTDSIVSDDDENGVYENVKGPKKAQEAEDEVSYERESRGKKRAQSQTPDTSLDRILEGSNTMEAESQAITLPLLRLRQLKEKKAYYPYWLSEQFHIRSDDWTPKPSRQQLDLLCEAIQEVPMNLLQVRQLFQNVFGPIYCYKQDHAIMQSVQSVYRSYGTSNVRLLKSGMIIGPATSRILRDDHFIYNYLKSFPTAASFFEHNMTMQDAYPDFLMAEMHERMARWLGEQSETGYEYWARARTMYLGESVKHRPMKPEDLNIEERQEWINRLEHCTNFDDAVTVTEEVFGPLSSSSIVFPCPQVDIEKFWNPCQCNICLRSRKRIKLDDEST